MIKTIDEARKYIPLTSAFSTESLPSFDQAINLYLLPILGDDLYIQLSAAYEDDNLTSDEAKLLPLCQAVIAYFAFAEEMPMMQMKLTDSGIMVPGGTENRNPYKWEYNNLIDNLSNKGYTAQETLIIYLKGNKSKFPAWSASPYNALSNFPLVRDGSDMSGVMGLLHRHRCYMLLQGVFQTVAELTIKPAISDAYYKALSSRINAGTSSDLEKELIAMLRMAAIHKALELASIRLSMRFDKQGFTIAYETKEQADESRQAAKDNQLRQFRDNMKDFARTLVEKAVTFLNEHASATVFPEYFTSGLYKDPNGSSQHIDNSEFTGLFAP